MGHHLGGALAIPIGHDLSDETNDSIETTTEIDTLSIEDNRSDEIDQHQLVKRNVTVQTDELSRRLIAHQQQRLINKQNGQNDNGQRDHSLEDVAEQFIRETQMAEADARQVMDQLEVLDNLSLEDLNGGQQQETNKGRVDSIERDQSDEILNDYSRERDDVNDNDSVQQVPDDWFLVRQYLDEFYSWALQDDLAREYFWTPIKTSVADPAVVDHPIQLTQAVIRG